MNQIDTEKWLASLFSELIQRGINSQEHIHFHGSPLGDSPAPNLEELKEAHLGWTGEFLTELLQEHYEKIINDYEKIEGKNHER